MPQNNNCVQKYVTTGGPLTDSGIFDDGTNCGIGTTSPSYKLDINGDARAQDFHVRTLTASGDASDLIVAENTTGNQSGLILKNTSGQAGEVKTSAVNLVINVGLANGKLSLQIQGQEKLAITSSGDVKFAGTNSTGTQAPLLGSNAPTAMVTTTAPYTWIRAQANDGTTVWIPAWK